MPKPNNPRKINWYRTKLDPLQLKTLNERSDFKGFLQAGGHLGLVILTGTLSFLFWQHGYWGSLIITLFLHGMIASFYINGIHEMVHGTVFKTSWLNDIFLNLYSFLDWQNHTEFWESHTEHHKYTLNFPDDMEVVLPKTLSFKDFLYTGFINIYFFIEVKNKVMNSIHYSMGKFRKDDKWFQKTIPITFHERRQNLISIARIRLFGHGLILIYSIFSGYWILPFIISFSSSLGGKWLFFLCNNSQHAGLIGNTPDFRLSCRTVYLNPIAEFLYWSMNYHIEHHMFAAVPCYNLRKCHEAIKHELPPINSLFDAWYEIISIQKKKEEDDTYEFIQKLPEQYPPVFKESYIHNEEVLKNDNRRTDHEDSIVKGNYKVWQCTICAFVYDESLGLPHEGIAPGTRWEDIPEDWSCPDCGTSKSNFEMVEAKNTIENDLI